MIKYCNWGCPDCERHKGDNMPVEAKKKGNFNPGLGGAFSNNSFAKNGEDGILLNVTAENINTLMQNVQIGSSILFRFNKVTTKGNKHYFAEILPPMTPKTTVTAARAKAAASELD